MEGSVEKQISVERTEALKEGMLNLVDEIRKANLLVPQTYGAIRVAGALSILKETSTNYDFSPQNLLDSYREHSEAIDKDITEQMQAAHAPLNIKPKPFENKTNEQMQKHVHNLLEHHFDVALTATGDALIMSDEYDGTVQEFTTGLVQPIYDALYRTDMRAAIREYRNNIAEDRKNKAHYAEKLQEVWLSNYHDLLKKEYGEIDEGTMMLLRNFFEVITDQSGRVMSDNFSQYTEQ